MKNSIAIGVATFAVGLLIGILAAGAGGNANPENPAGVSDRLDRIEKRLDSIDAIGARLGAIELKSAEIASSTAEIQKTTRELKKTIEPALARADGSGAGPLKGPKMRTPLNGGDDFAGLMSDNTEDGDKGAVEVAAIGRLVERIAVNFDPKKMEKDFYDRLQKKLDLTDGQLLDMKDLYKEKARKMREIWNSESSDPDDDDDMGPFSFHMNKEKREKLNELEKWFKSEVRNTLTADQYEKYKKNPMSRFGPPGAGGFQIMTHTSGSDSEDEDK